MIPLEVGDTIADAERRLILATIARFPKLADAAELLGVSRFVLYRKLKALGLTDRPLVERLSRRRIKLREEDERARREF